MHGGLHLDTLSTHTQSDSCTMHVLLQLALAHDQTLSIGAFSAHAHMRSQLYLV